MLKTDYIPTILLTLLILNLMSLNLNAQVDLQTALQDLEVGSDWIYGDLEQGTALAKETGKPLFVLFR
jgi:hypothetical protein